MSEKQTYFGAEKIPESQKQARVDDVFYRVAENYDLANDVLSLGMHRLWKNALIAWLQPSPLRKAYTHVDVAGGTGDLAFKILERAGADAKVVVLDVNDAMLARGRERATKRVFAGEATFVLGDAEAPPYDDHVFDSYTVSFGLRNVTRIPQALKEAHRILKRGGHFLCLEFAPVETPLFEKAYALYSDFALPFLGEKITGHADPYRYLSESIKHFPSPEAFADMMRDVGFERVVYRSYAFGIAHIHSGWKL